MAANEQVGASTPGGYYGADGQYPPEGRERGARRRKLAGYLKAANELRQSYQQSASSAWAARGSGLADYDQNEPGAFIDVSTVRAADEEMVIFPSYARKHVKKQRLRPPVDYDQARNLDSGAGGRQHPSGDDVIPSRQDWKMHDDSDDAVVDVDVRGCVYAPHRGPLTRKNRILIGLARQLSGIPVPSGTARNGSDGYQSGDDRPSQASRRPQTDSLVSKAEEDLVSIEAESIVKRGEEEAKVAKRGGYSEESDHTVDKQALNSRSGQGKSPDASLGRGPRPGNMNRQATDASLASTQGSFVDPTPITKRSSWNQPADMSPEELIIANENLLARLMPFLNTPILNVPITIFFYNNERSQSRTTFTNDTGHFSVRAALNFIPTNVRVLASEKLSATEEVIVSEPKGVSLISDIDDTIKHSAIASGAREIFRNTFVRDLGDLTIDGVKDWYRRLASMGVQLHYVSNSPWQLYPLLVKFFALAGLPPGSFHLKQYSGMLQGIFEPVAERKKGNLESIMRDFPERKFLLVGDSGEADLEVYTDVVLANPGRVIGVYIRDVTTSKQQGFFDPSIDTTRGERKSDPGAGQGGSYFSGEKESSGADVAAWKSERPSPVRHVTDSAIGNLIDLEDDGSAPAPSGRVAHGATRPSSTSDNVQLKRNSNTNHGSRVPAPPAKPSSLRLSLSAETPTSTPSEPSKNKANNGSSPAVKSAPIVPPKPRKFSQDMLSPTDTNTSRSAPASSDAASSGNMVSEDTTVLQGYMPGIRQKVSTAYNKLPSAATVLRGGTSRVQTSQDALPPPVPPRLSTSKDTHSPTSTMSPAAAAEDISRPSSPGGSQPARPLRRAISSYPAAAAQYASNRLSGNWNNTTTTTSTTTTTATSSSHAHPDEGTPASGPGPGALTNTTATTTAINKKEELWHRRWTRAKDILEAKGVELRSWRVGTDVLADSVRLVEKTMSRERGR